MVARGEAWSPDRTIEVDAQTIQRSIIGVSSHCMIAEAVKREFPEATFVAVDLQTIRFTDRKRGVRYVYLTPARAQQALVDFDQGEAISPFRFRLRHAQITPTRTGTPSGPASTKEAQAAIRALNRETRLVKPTGHQGQAPIPVRVGGKVPPTAVLSNSRGRIRVFGLRNLKAPRAG